MYLFIYILIHFVATQLLTPYYYHYFILDEFLHLFTTKIIILKILGIGYIYYSYQTQKTEA